MESSSAAHEFGALFRRIYLAFYQRHAPTEYVPTPEALAILQHLAATGPLTVGEAARHFSRSQATTSELVQRLEKRGYLERTLQFMAGMPAWADHPELKARLESVP